MSRMLLRPSYLFLALFTVVVVNTSSLLPAILNADESSDPCADAADTLQEAATLLHQQQQLLTLSLADEQAAAAAYQACESATPGMCGDEEANWELAFELVQLGVNEVATAIGELQVAQEVYNDCVNGGGGGEEYAAPLTPETAFVR